MSRLHLARRLLFWMAERAECWRDELESARLEQGIGHVEFVELNMAYVELHVARDSLRCAAEHIDQALQYRRAALEARQPPQNPEPSRFPLGPEKD